MDAIARIAEERIRKALEEGAFDNLPNAGKPLCYEDESWVPEDLRLVYRVLRNAGCVPPELALKKEILNLRALVDTIDDDAERLRRLRELDRKLISFNLIREKRGCRPLLLDELGRYEDKAYEKLMGGPL